MGLIVTAPVESPLTFSPTSRLNVKPIVFWCFSFSTFCSLSLSTAVWKGKKKLRRPEVGSPDCCSLLKRDFVFQVTEPNNLSKRILSAQALPSSFKAFTSCNSLNSNNHLRPVGWPLQGEGPSPSTPPSFSLCSQPQRAGGGRIMVLPLGGYPWPSAQACFSSPPCQGSTLHLAIGYRIFSPPGCICLPFTK